MPVDLRTLGRPAVADDPHGNDAHSETFAVDGDTQPPENHAADHSAGGPDEIDVSDLQGVLAERQDPQNHSGRHQSGGEDELSLDGLSGDLADRQDPKNHASRHEQGGPDEIDASDLSGAAGADEQVLTSDGTNASWEPAGVDDDEIAEIAVAYDFIGV